MQIESNYVADLPGSTLNTDNAIQSAMRFLWLLRRHRMVLLLSVTVCLALGGLYFATAPRTYRAKGAILVRELAAEFAAYEADKNRQMSPNGGSGC